METKKTADKYDIPAIGVVHNCKNLNIRKEPDGNAEVLGTVSVDTEIMIDESESTAIFYKVCTATGMEGFCMREFIRILP